jgi:hypothetical protein
MHFWQDSNGRTIWYSGEAGPLAPKVKKVKGRMIWKAEKRVPVSGETEVEETQAVLWIRDLLVRIRMRICLTDPDAGPGGPKTYVLILRIRIRNTGKKS